MRKKGEKINYGIRILQIINDPVIEQE